MSKEEDKDTDFECAEQGASITPQGVKLPVSIRLDGEVIDFFKSQAEASGGKAKYQTLINEALKEYVSGATVREILLSDEFVGQLSKKLKAG